MQFFIEVMVGGLLAGVMYSLVALGFVLIYKASGVFNFAQGALVLFAALTFVSIEKMGVPFWIALAITLGIMVLMGVAIERIVLRRLVNQPPISLFMATIGLSFFIEGLAQTVWGTEVHGLELGITDEPFDVMGVFISKFDLFAATLSGVLVAGLALFFQKTKLASAARGVADDYQAALSAGIPLKHIWAIVWAVAGFVALVAGMLWGSRLGVQFALTLVVLKALPVLILGGFTSVPGAIVGGRLPQRAKSWPKSTWARLSAAASKTVPLYAGAGVSAGAPRGLVWRAPYRASVKPA
ncbi:MAG: branched-chain amino acid ABC transporter permease [Rivihabitans pingtungensis]